MLARVSLLEDGGIFFVAHQSDSLEDLRELGGFSFEGVFNEDDFLSSCDGYFYCGEQEIFV